MPELQIKGMSGFKEELKHSSSNKIQKLHRAGIAVHNSSNMNISNNKFASASNMNSGNVITDRPSSRVLNPPGGKSTISLC